MAILLTYQQASEEVSLSESTIKRMISKGQFPHPVSIGDNKRFRMTDLVAWADSLSTRTESEEKPKRGRKRLAV